MSAQNLPAIPIAPPNPDSTSEMIEFARRLGEVAAVISDQPWEQAEPMLQALWCEAKSSTTWTAVRSTAYDAWQAARCFYPIQADRA